MTDECKRIGKDGLPTMPKLSCENNRFIDGFFSRVAPGLFTGTGGYDYNAICLAFDAYSIQHPGQKAALMDKCLVMISAHSEARRRKHGKS